MSISCAQVVSHNGGMNKTNTTAVAPGRGTGARPTDPRRNFTARKAAVTRARDARRQLRSREDRFAHLKRMYD